MDWQQMAQTGGDWTAIAVETGFSWTVQPIFEGGIEMVFHLQTGDYMAAAGTGVGIGAEMTAGKIVRGAKAAKEGLKTAKEVVKKAPDITKPYKRPSGATTKAQRESVQDKPCVDCGARTPKQYADHKDPLVKEYYRTGTIDKTRMRDVDSVQPQCPTCSNQQGAELSRFSRQQKKDLGL